jgi:purine-binding chemotaxis protein CheW
MSEAAQELIVVRIAGQIFATDIMAVREIRGWTASVALPHAPDYMLGMINLRGQILPVIDFAARLGLAPATPNAASVVVVCELGDQLVGLLVEAVCDIIAVQPGQVQPTPDVGAAEVAEFVRGLINTDEGIVTLLSLDALRPEPEALAA